MSADNWTQCPKCEVKKEDRLGKVRLLYGTIPPEKYEQLLAEAQYAVQEEERESDTDTPLREDWELGVDQGKFEVSYSASCQNCGWELHFNHEQKVP